MSGRILIVDDEEIVLRSCQRILAGRDYEIDTASNGAEGLRMVEGNYYDVLILDIKMPRMDGLEVLQRRIGAAEVGQQEPTIANLLGVLGVDQQQALDAGQGAAVVLASQVDTLEVP